MTSTRTTVSVVQLSINTSSVCCPHRTHRRHPVWRLFSIYLPTLAYFFHFSFALPFIIATCSALIIGTHLFRRWCRHSPSLRPYKIPPTPLRSSGDAPEEIREERGRKREEETLKQTYGVPVSTIEEGESVCARRRPC